MAADQGHRDHTVRHLLDLEVKVVDAIQAERRESRDSHFTHYSDNQLHVNQIQNKIRLLGQVFDELVCLHVLIREDVAL